MRLWLFRLFVVLIGLPCAAAATESNVEFIKRLYEAYAWESTDNSPKGKTPFINEPRAELVKYLEPTLAEALLQDRQCAKQTRQICRLDFSPMWASQDPGARELQVKRGSNASRVKVSFTYPGSGERIVIEYELSVTAAGPRIREVYYATGPALSKILGVH